MYIQDTTSYNCQYNLMYMFQSQVAAVHIMVQEKVSHQIQEVADLMMMMSGSHRSVFLVIKLNVHTNLNFAFTGKTFSVHESFSTREPCIGEF